MQRGYPDARRARGTLGLAPYFPERNGPSCTSGLASVPSVDGTSKRSVCPCDLAILCRRSAVRVGNRDRGLEPRLDELVEHADDPVELDLGEVFERHAANEVNVLVLTE